MAFGITQAAYQFYADDGSESGSSALGAQSTPLAIDISGGNLDRVLRVRIDETGSVSTSGATTDDYQLQYSKNGGSFVSINTGTSNVRAFASANLTDGAASTQRLSSGSGSFVAGEVSEDGLVDDFQLTADNYTELVYAVRFVAADLAEGDSIVFRVLLNDQTTNVTYSTTPTTIVGVRRALTVGTLALAGAMVGLSFMGPTSGALAFTGHAPTVQVGSPAISIPVGALSLTGQAPSTDDAGDTETPATGALTLAGYGVGVAFQGPAVGGLTLTGLAPTMSSTGSGLAITPAAATLAFAGSYVDIIFQGPDVGGLAFTGHAPLLSFVGTSGNVITVPSGSLTATGRAPALAFRSSISAGTLALAGPAPTVLNQLGTVTPIGVGALSLTGLAPTVALHNPRIAIGAGTLTINGLGLSATSSAIPPNVQAIVEVQLTPGAWTAITDDVVSEVGLVLRYGIQGNGPTDCVAGTGDCLFALRNDAGNSGGTLGWYSPAHANRRNGWGHGIPIRVLFTTHVSLPLVTKFLGKVREILPDPGLYRDRRVHVVAYDYARDVIEADLRDVAIQIGESEDTVIGAVLDAIPAANQPPARLIDTGLDQLPYALDDIGEGEKAGSALKRVALSSYGLCFFRGDGTFRYMNRNNRALESSAYAVSDSDIAGLVAPSSLESVYNRVRTTNHPKTVDASDVVLYALTGTPPVVPGMDTITIEGTFRDPNNTLRAIGAVSTVAVVSSTDYAGNSQPDGSGTDLTASLSITATVNASRVVFSVANLGGSPIYLVNASGDTKLQIRGRGIYDLAPRTFETTSGNADRPITIDLPYSDNDGIAQQIGTFIRTQYEDLASQINEVTLKPMKLGTSSDTTRATQAINRDVGDVITITEAVTGMSAIEARILSVQLEVRDGNILHATWGTAPVIDVEPPTPPTGLAASIESDVRLTLTWTMAVGATGAQTLIYRNGVHVGTTGAAVTSWTDDGLTPATDYTYSARHMLLSLISDPTSDVVARPTVQATGGTISQSGGYRYHRFTSSGTFTITREGHIDFVLIGGGGGGAAGGLNLSNECGGGGGGAGAALVSLNNQEPIGSFAVTIGAGGSGGSAGVSDGNNGTNGSDTTYRSEVARGGGYGGGVVSGIGANGNDGGCGGGGGGGSTGGVGGGAIGGLGLGGGAGYSAGSSDPSGGGGGGGTGSAGFNAVVGVGGFGGVGVATFDGTFGTGGNGGRGYTVTSGAANTGNGGFGGNYSESGGDGGSGFAVFRYPI